MRRSVLAARMDVGGLCGLLEHPDTCCEKRMETFHRSDYGPYPLWLQAHVSCRSRFTSVPVVAESCSRYD